MTMAYIGVGIGVVGLGVGIAGQLNAADKARAQGRTLNDLAEFEARQMETNATQQIASAQRQALDEDRKSTILQSRALALVAASGGGASDPTVTKILADLAGEGHYRRMVAMYDGEERSRLMRLAAVTRRKEGAAGLAGGAASAQAYQIAAAGTGISGAGNLLSKKYGGQGLFAGTQTTAPAQTTNIDSGGFAGVNDTSWSESAP